MAGIWNVQESSSPTLWTHVMTHYEILDVAADATTDQIKRAFRKKALATHPDLNRQSAEATRRAHQGFIDLSNVYRELIDPDRRSAYDRRIAPAEAVTIGAVQPAETVGKYRPELHSYYQELDDIREQIWNTPRNEFLRELLMYACVVVLSVPIYILMLRHVFELRDQGLPVWRSLAGSMTVPVIMVFSLWQISLRYQRVRAAGGLRRFWKRRNDRRKRPRGGDEVRLGYLPFILVAVGFLDAAVLLFSDEIGHLNRSLMLAVVPVLLLGWIMVGAWRRRRVAH